MTNNKLFLIILILVACASQLATDIYIPAIVTIAHQMHTTTEHIELSIPIYLAGTASTQLIYGAISEGLGRKPPLVFGMCVMTIGSVVCALASNPTMLLVGRLIQGIGGGAATSLWRPMLRDVFSGKDLSRIGGYLSIIFTFVVPAAPLLGALIEKLLNFAAVTMLFGFLVIYGIISLVLIIFCYTDTNQDKHLSKLDIGYMLKSYREVICHKEFLFGALSSLLMYGAVISWVTTGPAILIKFAHITPMTFGWFNLIGCAVVFTIAAKLNTRLLNTYSIEKILKLSSVIVFGAGVILIASEYYFGTTFIGSAIAILVFYLGSGLLWPNAFAIAFRPFAKNAGYAGAMYSCFQIGGGAIIGSLAAKLPHSNFYVLGIILAGAAILSNALRTIINK